MSPDIQNTLKFSPSVQRFYRWTLVGLLLVEIIIIRLNIHKILEGPWYSALITLALASTVPISIFIRLFFYVRPWLKAEYQVYADHLLVCWGKKNKELNFSNIQSVRFSILSPRFFGGFSVQLKSGKVFRFFSLLENSHLILDKVYKLKPELIPDDKYNKYMRRALMLKHSWGRMQAKLFNWKLLSIKYFAVPLIMAWWLWWQQLCFYGAQNFQLMFVSVLLFSWGMGLVLNHFEENYLLKQTEDSIEKSGLVPKLEVFNHMVFLTFHVLLAWILASAFGNNACVGDVLHRLSLFHAK